MTSEIPPLKASILFISNKQLTNLRDTGLWYVAVTTAKFCFLTIEGAVNSVCSHSFLHVGLCN